MIYQNIENKNIENKNIVNQDQRTLEFNIIRELLSEYAVTEAAKKECEELTPVLSELILKKMMRDTTDARKILDAVGTPPLQDTREARTALEVAEKDGLLTPEQLERVQVFAAACKRFATYLGKAKELEVSLAFYGDGIADLEEVYSEINRCIRGGEVDDNASRELSNIRRQIDATEQQIRNKIEEIMKAKKQYCSDTFISSKNGHYTLPVKKEYKFQVPGVVVATSATGTTCFIEPTAISKMTEKVSLLKVEEELEVERILYQLTALVYENRENLRENMTILETMDFVFAKGKLSLSMEAEEPEIRTDRQMKIVRGRHPLLSRDSCVPIDFAVGENYRGIVITGPNTGGKTVALKLVGLFSLMAQSGLHLPCESAAVCMNSNVVCDIGDGQDISQNLSTFSAHITNVVRILNQTGPQTLVLLDELGSGTDPAEGMGIAIATLEELRNRGCLFVATTHYAEVKNYAEAAEGLINARMTFDKETLKPQYCLVLGEAGESCAFYVAKRLGFPEHLLAYARLQTYGTRNDTGETDVKSHNHAESFSPVNVGKIQKIPEPKKVSTNAESFRMGDSVMVYPERKVGIVYRTADEKGDLIVQIQGKKQIVNHKRLKLKASAAELYPADYDFSIVFDTVENRKAKHQMGRKYSPDTVAHYEPAER